MFSPAVFSPCRRWRYSLFRQWSENPRLMLFIGLNPSIADETRLDPTLRRCVSFAKSFSCGGLLVGNVFGWVSTDPDKLPRIGNAVGEENDDWLAKMAGAASMLICGWGQHKRADKWRQREVLKIIVRAGASPLCLGVNADGSPSHPLYLPAEMGPLPWPKEG